MWKRIELCKQLIRFSFRNGLKSTAFIVCSPRWRRRPRGAPALYCRGPVGAAGGGVRTAAQLHPVGPVPRRVRTPSTPFTVLPIPWRCCAPALAGRSARAGWRSMEVWGPAGERHGDKLPLSMARLQSGCVSLRKEWQSIERRWSAPACNCLARRWPAIRCAPAASASCRWCSSTRGAAGAGLLQPV